MKFFLVWLIMTVLLFSEETNTTTPVTFNGMPTLSSNPTSGTGVGLMGIMVYNVDPGSSPSQTMLMGQYTNTDSYNVFAINKMFFDSDNYQSNTVIGNIFNNSEFDLGIPFTPMEESANFDVTMFVAMQQILYRVMKDVYMGGQLFYIGQKFNALNATGQGFLIASGIEDSSRVGLGATVSYDTRTKKEKFYPRDSQLVNLVFNDFPEEFGSEERFYNVSLNARHYQEGFKDDDVLALQLYYQYSSPDTPDGALSALGARNILRGFSIGQYKARNMFAIQAEYRYQVTDTRFRVAAFGGYANLSGGSKETAQGGSRDSNNGDYSSFGAGVRYTLQEEQGIDYRIDIARTSTDDYAVYASLNQAF